MDGSGDHVNEVSQTQEDKGCMFFLVCGRYNKYTYKYIYDFICILIYTYISISIYA
jgi:hypothetical protein